MKCDGHPLKVLYDEVKLMDDILHWMKIVHYRIAVANNVVKRYRSDTTLKEIQTTKAVHLSGKL